MIRETRAIAAEGQAIELDPFAFWPDIASRLVGLGGADVGENPDYALHTRYVSCGDGPIVFTVRLEGLAAQRGTLILRVHELPEVIGAQARQIAISQIQLLDLIRGDATASLAAIARSQHHYALVGFIYGDTAATAARVAVEVGRRSPEAHDVSMPTAFRAKQHRIATAPQLVGDHEGSLVTPVSQPCTAGQLNEPVFEAVLSQLSGLADSSPIRRWELAFLARVLDRYDVARSGARGLGIEACNAPLASWLVEHGCSLVVTTSGDPELALDSSPSVEIRCVDPMAIDGLSGFDFAWAARDAGLHGADRHTVLRFIEDALRALKPAGLLTLVIPIDVAPRKIGDEGGPVLRQPDIDRIALLLLSRGHQVAQICPWGDIIADANEAEKVMISAFGLIIRKAG